MTGPVVFPVPREVAFDYLVDPRNRPEWQRSLRGVAGVGGEPRVGQTWVDVTVPGFRPALETVELNRPRRWAERGSWHGLRAELALDFAGAPAGCEVTFDLRLAGRGLLAPLARLLAVVAPYAVRADLRRAAAILSQRCRHAPDP